MKKHKTKAEEEAACEDMADVCELAHNRTVKECRRRGIAVDLREDESSDEAFYTPKAQIIFNRHYNEIIERTNL